MTNILYWLFALKVSLCNCHSERDRSQFQKGKPLYKVTKIGRLPTSISESSGLARVQGKNTFWTHNDGGNSAELFEIDSLGKQISELPLPQLNNEDWEDLAQDEKGGLYIADVGNNSNSRKNLVIYKLKPSQPKNVEKIAIRFADQTKFPPTLKDQNFDCEAVVYDKDKLYLFSKNRSPTNRFVKMYEIPAYAGTYTPAPKDSVYIKSMVTSADISPDRKTLALLTYGKVFLFDISEGMSLKKPTYCIKIGKGQVEAILFINNQDFVFTNEHKRELYLVERK